MSLPAKQHMQAAATIAAGFPELPADLAGKIDAIALCIKAGRKLSHWLAVLVARARDDYMDPSGWILDMQDKFGWKKEHVHHMRQVGDLFWALRPQGECCVATQVAECCNTTLSQCSFDVLLPIARIPHEQVPAFLQGAKVAEMNRDEVREAVAKFLGEAPKQPKTPPKPIQLDFMDELFSTSADPAEWQLKTKQRLAKASVQEAWAGTVNAMEIVAMASEKLGRSQLEQLGAVLAQAAEQCKEQAKGRL